MPRSDGSGLHILKRDSSSPRLVILDALASSTDYVSGDSLATKLGMSRAAVWKHVNALKQQGYGITSTPNKGYRLEYQKDSLLPGHVRSGLSTELLGNAIFYTPSIDSTNRLAKELALSGEAEGAIIIGGEQTGGRGRLDREWTSPGGGLWLSILLRPDCHPNEAGRLLLAVGVSMAEAVRNVTGLDVKLKWPNDLVLDDKKLCGVLTELGAQPQRIDWLVAGVGLNANNPLSSLPGDVQKNATTLAHELGKKVDRAELVRRFLAALEGYYGDVRNGRPETVMKRWRELSATLGRKVEVRTGNDVVAGQAVDIDDFGSLIIKTGGGETVTVMTGDCIHCQT